MKKFNLMIGIVFSLCLAAGAANAGKSSLERGQKLFEDPSLGGSTNDKSCNSCHAAGKGLGGARDGKKISKKINRCLTGAMQGHKIDGRSTEMRSLKMYVGTLNK